MQTHKITGRAQLKRTGCGIDRKTLSHTLQSRHTLLKTALSVQRFCLIALLPWQAKFCTKATVYLYKRQELTFGDQNKLCWRSGPYRHGVGKVVVDRNLPKKMRAGNDRQPGTAFCHHAVAANHERKTRAHVPLANDHVIFSRILNVADGKQAHNFMMAQLLENTRECPHVVNSTVLDDRLHQAFEVKRAADHQERATGRGDQIIRSGCV